MIEDSRQKLSIQRPFAFEELGATQWPESLRASTTYLGDGPARKFGYWSSFLRLAVEGSGDLVKPPPTRAYDEARQQSDF